MSKLDDILEQLELINKARTGLLLGYLPQTKHEIKALMLELIGEDGIPKDRLHKSVVRIRNDLRAELRKKVQEL